MIQPAGLLAFPLTPFGRDDRIELEVFASHLAQQLEARRTIASTGEPAPAAWFVACGTGEFSALSLTEYSNVVSTAVKVVGDHAPVFAGAGGGPQVAREFATTAQQSGAQGLLLLPPYLVTCSPHGLVEHIRYVASATPLPIVVYQRANAVLDPASAVALLDIPTVIGIKDGIGDIENMSKLITAIRTSGHPRANEFGFLNGLPTAEVSASAYHAIGVDSYSSAVLSFAPDLALAFYTALIGGDSRTVRTLLKTFYLPFAELRRQAPGYAVALVKAAARLEGLAAGPVRPPLQDPAPHHLDQLSRILDEGRSALATLTNSRTGK